MLLDERRLLEGRLQRDPRTGVLDEREAVGGGATPVVVVAVAPVVAAESRRPQLPEGVPREGLREVAPRLVGAVRVGRGDPVAEPERVAVAGQGIP